MNNLVMYDVETDSLWSQFLGEAVAGPLEGAGLQLRASQISAWATWRGQHPDTLVLDTAPYGTGPLGWTSDDYQDYYFDGRAGLTGETHADPRFSKKRLVVGVAGESGQIAYPEGALQRQGVINDTFEGRPLLVAWDARTGAAAVHLREADGMTLTFDAREDPHEMVDRETGSTWNRVSGEAESGKLAGERLEPVRSIKSFWFAWTDFYPDTRLYEP